LGHDEFGRFNAKDFLAFNLNDETWTEISSNVEIDGGPVPFENGQMILADNNEIYVFGGLIRDNIIPFGPLRKEEYLGLFNYNFDSKKWNYLYEYESFKRNEAGIPSFSENHFQGKLKGRYSHAMIYYDDCIFIYGGMRRKKMLTDLIRISLATKKIEKISCLQRHSIQVFPKGHVRSNKHEFLFFSGFTTEEFQGIQSKTNHKPQINMLIFDLKTATWTQVEQSKSKTGKSGAISKDESYSKPLIKNQSMSPVTISPRFGYDFVYSTKDDIYYLFGGNPNFPIMSGISPLNDFWKFTIGSEPVLNNMTQRLNYLLDKEEVLRMLSLSYLPEFDNETNFKTLENLVKKLKNDAQTLGDQKEISECRAIVRGLFLEPEKRLAETESRRKNLFEEMLKLFPQEIKQPVKNF
jgi:hypothetical protein